MEVQLMVFDLLVGCGGCVAIMVIALAVAHRPQGRRRLVVLVSGVMLFALVVALCTQASAIQTAFSKLSQRPSPSGATLILPFRSGLERSLISMSGRDGSIRWTRPTLHLNDPVIVAGVAYTLGFATQDGAQPVISAVSAYRLSDGALLWSALEPNSLILTRLLVAHGLLIFGASVSSSIPQSTPPADQPSSTSLPPPPSFVIYAVDSHSHTLAWTAQTPDNPVTLATAGDLLFAGMGDGMARALRLRDGSLVWRDQVRNGAGATAVAAGGNLLYAVTANGVIVALRPADGSEVWTTQTSLAFGFHHQVTNPPAYTPTNLYLCGSPGGGSINALVALDPLTGAIRWRREIGCEHEYSPYGLSAALVALDGAVYTTAGDSLMALRASDGSTLWSRTTETPDLGFTGVSADHGVVFAAATLVYFRNLTLCWWQTPISICHNPDYIGAFDGHTGAVYWKSALDSPAKVASSAS